MLKKQGDSLNEPLHYKESLQHYNRALKINKKAGRQAEVARCLNNIGTLLEAQGDLDAALTYLDKALVIDRAIYGADHEKVAIRLNNIGRVLGKGGNWQAALEHHCRALEIYDKVHDRQSRHVGMSLYWIARARLELGQPDEARHCFEEALPALKRFYAPEHPFWTECKPLLALVVQEDDPDDANMVDG